jgi:hypothetical protein
MQTKLTKSIKEIPNYKSVPFCQLFYTISLTSSCYSYISQNSTSLACFPLLQILPSDDWMMEMIFLLYFCRPTPQQVWNGKRVPILYDGLQVWKATMISATMEVEIIPVQAFQAQQLVIKWML